MIFANLNAVHQMTTRMKRLLLIAMAGFLCISTSYAQNRESDVFSPICKYFQHGDYEKLSAWFADDLELDIMGAVNNCTRNQAKLIMRNFFTNYNPKHFTIIHKSGKSPMKYAVGTLDAGGEKFRIILYVKANDSKSYIQQLKIERE